MTPLTFALEVRNMKNTLYLLGIALIVLFLGACGQEPQQDNQNDEYGEQTETDTTGEGEAVFGVTDAAADMGAVSEIHMTIDSVKVRSQTQGWVTVSSTPATYDLLELKEEGRTALLAQAELPEGTYDEMELVVSSVTVVDTEGTHEATMPSNTMTFDGYLVVKEGQTATATFDILADQSLHMTEEGEYIMAPVIEVETRSNAEVDVSNEEDIAVSGGQLTTSVTIGMDIDGNVGVGLRIAADAVLSLTGGVLGILDSEGSVTADVEGTVTGNY